MTNPPGDSSGEGAQHRVLIVPADLLLDELGESFLDRSSFAVRTASAPSEALAIAEVWRPSVVVFSSRLEGVTTDAFCEQVREGSQRVALLMVTDRVGEAPPEVDATSCDAHLVSPLQAHELLGTIAELTGIRQRVRPRHVLEVLVHTEGFTGEEGEEATLSNSLELTEEGLLLEAGRHFDVGASGRMLFFLPGNPQRLQVSGVVRAAVDEVRLLYRVDFVDLAPQHRTLIRKLLGQRESGA